MTSTYDASSIKHLTGVDALRAKPQMYIGPTDAHGLFTILREVGDNAVDEALAGHCSRIGIVVDDSSGDYIYTVVDDGRGMPVGNMTVKDSVTNKSVSLPAIQAITSLLHAGGKLSRDADSAYRVSIGSHGVGIKATNFLSSWFRVFTFNRGAWWGIEYSEGQLSTPLHKLKRAPRDPLNPSRALSSGTVVSFQPNLQFFSASKFSPSMLMEWATMKAYFTPNLTVDLKVKTKSVTVHFENGVQQYIEDRVSVLNAEASGDPFVFSSPLVDCLFTWSSYDGCDMGAFTNGLQNMDRGTHFDTFFKVLMESVSVFAPKTKDGKVPFTVAELREGIIGVLNIKLSSPQFGGQTKEKLVDSRGQEPLADELREPLKKWVKANRATVIAAIEKAVKLKELKGKFVASKAAIGKIRAASKKGFSAKAAVALGCTSEERELFLVEGDSALGCFLGSTRVRLLNGESARFDDMARRAALGEQFKGYAYDLANQRSVVIDFDTPRLTKYVTEYTVVTLSNGYSEGSTTDHPYLTHEGQYVAAQDLTPGTRLMEHSATLVESRGRRVPRICLPAPVSVVSVSTVTVDTPVPVYDATVPVFHNFALEAGIYVHNTARAARDSHYQEALPLRGKILNVGKGTKDERVFDNREVISILAQLGFDPKNPDPMEKLRVGKVVLLADPDPDGPLAGDTLIPVRVSGTWTLERIDTLAQWTHPYKVLSWNGERIVAAEASDARVTVRTADAVKFTSGREHTLCARSHKWMIPNRGRNLWRGEARGEDRFLPSESLKDGDHICSVGMSIDGQQSALSALTRRELTSTPATRVKQVTLSEPQPFYCLTVPSTGNFVTASGLVSSNCHITVLLLTLFYRFLPGLFERGMVYSAVIPEYYALDSSGKLWTGSSADELASQLAEKGVKANVQHIKGYGEVSSAVLRKLAFDPETRSLARISTLPDGGDVNFWSLVGSGTDARKKLLGI